jgi:hypothetical protein
MATLKALSTLIVSGSVAHTGSVFHCPDALAASLVESGLAFELKEAEGTDVTKDSSVLDDEDEVEKMRQEYAAMTVPQLAELAQANGIDLTGLTRKSEYIDALIDYELGE